MMLRGLDAAARRAAAWCAAAPAAAAVQPMIARGLSAAARGPVNVSAEKRAAWEEAQARTRWWNDLFASGGDVFTLHAVAPTLEAHWARVPNAAVPVPASGVSRVLVPGVGRDVSARWLARREGWGAVGVDVSDAALRALGDECGGLAPIHEGGGGGGGGGAPRWAAYAVPRVPRLLLVHGDACALTPADYGGRFEAAWDRGALTAMPDADAYARALAAALAPRARALIELLATDVPAHGAADEAAARAALKRAGFATVETLARRDVRAEYPAFRPPGMTRLDEVVLLAENGDE